MNMKFKRKVYWFILLTFMKGATVFLFNMLKYKSIERYEKLFQSCFLNINEHIIIYISGIFWKRTNWNLLKFGNNLKWGIYSFLFVSSLCDNVYNLIRSYMLFLDCFYNLESITISGMCLYVYVHVVLTLGFDCFVFDPTNNYLFIVYSRYPSDCHRRFWRHREHKIVEIFLCLEEDTFQTIRKMLDTFGI